LSNEIIEFVAQSERFMPHFHIPLQSGSDAILTKMRRRYKTSLYRQRVEKIKELMPHASIGVDVITGFPGETHEEFLNTYRFLNELDVSYLHVFTYSERDNTDAIEMYGTVPYAERKERSNMLRILSDKKKRAFYESQLETETKVLFEADVEDGKMHGFTENYIRLEAEFDPLLINEIRNFRLKSVTDGMTAKGYELVNKAVTI
jgi:threonylcarbamoyladenosine tRNA methylthiotransferase MtaB